LGINVTGLVQARRRSAVILPELGTAFNRELAFVQNGDADAPRRPLEFRKIELKIRCASFSTGVEFPHIGVNSFMIDFTS
jgi:hypothetical protein